MVADLREALKNKLVCKPEAGHWVAPALGHEHIHDRVLHVLEVLVNLVLADHAHFYLFLPSHRLYCVLAVADGAHVLNLFVHFFLVSRRQTQQRLIQRVR